MTDEQADAAERSWLTTEIGTMRRYQTDLAVKGVIDDRTAPDLILRVVVDHRP